MRVTIAGYGAIGAFHARLYGRRHEVLVYDPPKGFADPEVLRDTDFVLICVPTPQAADGSCDTRSVEEIVMLSNPRDAIICHSTVAIGTTDELIETHGKPLVFIPEYAGESPGHPYREIENRTFFFLGGYEPALSRARGLLESAYGPQPVYHLVPPRVAETVKYMENAFLALKVGFCNAFFDLCRAVGVGYDLVRDLWLEDRRVNPSHTSVSPERGYGGKCLPKDVAAVCASARRAGAPLELLETLRRVNDRQRAAASHETGKRREHVSEVETGLTEGLLRA